MRLKYHKTGHGNCPRLGFLESCSRWILVSKTKECPWDQHGWWEGQEAGVEEMEAQHPCRLSDNLS